MPNKGAPQYIRQTLRDIKGEIDSNTIIVGEFNTPLTPMDRPSKQKINKKAQVLNDILDEMLISLISSGYSIQMQKNTPYSHMHHVTFSRIYHILVHKSNFSQFKKIEILSSIFSEHNAIRLDINYKKRKKNCKKHKHMEIKQHISK